MPLERSRAKYVQYARCVEKRIYVVLALFGEGVGIYTKLLRYHRTWWYVWSAGWVLGARASCGIFPLDFLRCPGCVSVGSHRGRPIVFAAGAVKLHLHVQNI